METNETYHMTNQSEWALVIGNEGVLVLVSPQQPNIVNELWADDVSLRFLATLFILRSEDIDPGAILRRPEHP